LEESVVQFPPTYKFDEGTDTYDSGPKHRTPSWTDRILVKTFPPKLSVGIDTEPTVETDAVRAYAPQWKYVTQSYYRNDPPVLNYPERPETELYVCQDGKVSDHRPVRATFSVKVPVEVPARLEQLDVVKRRKREEMENMALPVLDVPREATIPIGSDYRVDLRNVGVVFARWEALVLGQGVKVTPSHGTLIPGTSVELSINVSKLSPAPVDVLFNASDRTVAAMTVTAIVRSRLRTVTRGRGDLFT
jgi:hypothetical protein